jgi:hypothetical protein
MFFDAVLPPGLASSGVPKPNFELKPFDAALLRGRTEACCVLINGAAEQADVGRPDLLNDRELSKEIKKAAALSQHQAQVLHGARELYKRTSCMHAALELRKYLISSDCSVPVPATLLA